MKFSELVKEFDRMCEFYDDETENPFYKETDSTNWEDWWVLGSYEPEKFEEIVATFSKEHPAPIYPTIMDLLRHIAGYIGPEYVNKPLNELVKEQIPQEVAEEWGIMPINECGLTKYSEWR